MARRSTIAALLATAGAVLSGCGSGANVNANALLSRAFTLPVPSARTKVDLTLSADGLRHLEGPLEVKFEGPYDAGRGGSPPRFNWPIHINLSGLEVSPRFIADGGPTLVQALGGTYRLPAEPLTQLGFGALGLHPRTWFEDPHYVGTDGIDGQQARHITGTLDTAALLSDFAVAARRLGPRGRGAALGLRRARQAIAAGLTDSFADVWVGVDDGVLRKLEVGGSFLNTDQSLIRSAGGVSQGSASIEITEDNVGDPHPVSAPPGPYRPSAQLLDKVPAFLRPPGR